MRKFWIALLILIALAVPPVQAQTSAQAALMGLDLGSYPQVGVYLDASSAGGGFLAGLRPNDITLLEDGQPVEVTQLLEENPGVELLVAVNPAPAMAIRDSRGTSRYEHILAALQAWGESSPGSESSTYSLLGNGIQATRGLETPADLVGALARYQPDFKRAIPSLESLTKSLDIALSEPAAAGTDRVILYITPPPENELLDALAGLRAQAEQSGARIHIWMVGSRSLIDSPGAAELGDLAAATGGDLFAYSGVEELPSLDPTLEGLGRIYSLRYKSQVQSGTAHTLTAEINLDGEIIRTPALNFDFNILPPSPMFLSPPASIERIAPAESENALEELTPRSYQLKSLVEFPDGQLRDLVAARLFVDGSLAIELTEPPFDVFTWDISAYTSGGTHRLRLEVEDVYGLKNSSLELPVDINITIPQLTLWEQFTRPRMLASLGAFILAGIILGLVLFFAGRRHSTPAGSRRADLDPLTQPVHPARESEGREPGLPRRRSSLAVADALLVPLDENNQAAGEAIPLSGGETTFGRDPSLAAIVLDSPSVDNLHARLKCTGGVYILADNGSVAGTWVNYAPISREGLHLEHGDIIHFGRLAYRFLLSQPAQNRQPSVRAYNGPQ